MFLMLHALTDVTYIYLPILCFSLLFKVLIGPNLNKCVVFQIGVCFD